MGDFMNNTRKLFISVITNAIMSNKFVRNIAANKFDKYLYENTVTKTKSKMPKNVQVDKYYGLRAMFMSGLRNYNKGYISKKVAMKVVDTLVNQAMLKGGGTDEIIENYKKRHGIGPPSFIVLSPTKRCNLHCIGCYASSSSATAETLSFDTVNKIIQQAHDLFGDRFIVISGGEPMMYRSDGKTILDVVKSHPDMFFLMYTNGTLITPEVANEMAELGNITPAISVEGYKEETDWRRGNGTYDRILKAFENLRNAGVPFGISVTPTKKNYEILMSDEFYDLYFDKLGATYMWMFQYMPIGRDFKKDMKELMIEPEQRFNLFKKWKHLLKEKEYFAADFWNSATLSDGCIAYGRQGGYLYIDWNGKIMPCVFIPYSVGNIKDLFAHGKTIEDIIENDVLKRGREWQTKYKNIDGRVGNMLMPCSIRDNHRDFLNVIKGAEPEDEAAKEAMESEEYHKTLINFDNKLREITEPYWEKEYLSSGRASEAS